MSRLLHRGVRDESGFTLIELLVSMLIGIIVVIAALNLMDVGARSSTRTVTRVDVTQRGRTVLAEVQRRLRSQVCLDPDTPPITSGDNNTVKYYSDTDGDAYFAPQWHWLWFDSTWKGGRGAIRESVYRADQTATTGPPFTFTSAPTTRVLAEDVALQPNTNFLRYYAYNATDTALSTPLDTNITGDVLPVNSMAKVVRIDVSFRMLPSRTNDSSGAPTGNQTDALRDGDFDTSVYARNTDYTDTPSANRVWGPRCD